MSEHLFACLDLEFISLHFNEKDRKVVYNNMYVLQMYYIFYIFIVNCL